jgi:hypothetical protein
MEHFNGPRPPYRWQTGLLLLSLPRRLITCGLCDFAPGGADQPVPYPVGQAGPRQLGGLADQFLMLRSHPDVQGRRMTALRFLAHRESV